MQGVVDREDHRPGGVGKGQAAQVALGEQLVAFDVGQVTPAVLPHGIGFLGGGQAARQTSRACRDFRPYDRGSRASTLLVMFVRYYLELPLPRERVEHALLDSPPEWMAALASDASSAATACSPKSASDR